MHPLEEISPKTIFRDGVSRISKKFRLQGQHLVNEPCPVLYILLFKNVSQVIFDGPLADKKAFSDLGVSVTLKDVGNDFRFPLGEMAHFPDGPVIEFWMQRQHFHGNQKERMINIGESPVHHSATKQKFVMADGRNDPFLHGKGVDAHSLIVPETCFQRL